jgi:phenylacetate-CoA ligase
MNVRTSVISLYKKLMPFYIIPFTLTQTKVFHQNYQFLKKSEKWSPEQIREWQFQKIKTVIETAADSVPYYQRIFKKIGFEVGDFKSLDVLRQLPTISKLDVKANLTDLISTKAKKRDLVECFTGGSTGNPMRFYVDREKFEMELSFFYYIWEKYGYKIGDRCILLKGNKLANTSRNRFHCFDNEYNYLRLDSDYLSDVEYLRYYDDPIKKFGAKVLFGYPSSVFDMAKDYARSNLTPPQFDLVLLASENTYDDQLAFIQEVFQAKKIFFHYGHTEEVLLGFKHFQNNYLGFMPQYGHFELLDVDGREIAEEGAVGEIVGTGYSKNMPFIRYRTIDYARYTNYRADDFMRTYPSVKNIEGKLQEYVVTKDKRLVSIGSIGAAHFKVMANVVENQYYQDKEGELIFRIKQSRNEPVDERQLKLIREELEKKLEYTINVKVQLVDHIHKTIRNKKSLLVQKLDVAQYLR